MSNNIKIKAFKKDGSIKEFLVTNQLQVSIIDCKYERWEYIHE
jgi:hypothetical protein